MLSSGFGLSGGTGPHHKQEDGRKGRKEEEGRGGGRANEKEREEGFRRRRSKDPRISGGKCGPKDDFSWKFEEKVGSDFGKKSVAIVSWERKKKKKTKGQCVASPW